MGDYNFIGQSLEPGFSQITSNSATIDGAIYFLAQSEEFLTTLWKTDGTLTGTSAVTDETDANEPLEGRLFSVNERLIGIEDGTLWSTDDFSTLTTIATFAENRAANIWPFAERLFFETGGNIWSTDGTADGTSLVRGGYAFNHPTLNVVHANGAYYYPSRHLTDGTSAQAWQFDDRIGVATDFPYQAGQFGSDGDRLYFVESAERNYRGPLWELAPDSTPTTLGDVFSPVSIHSNGSELYVTSSGSEGTRLWMRPAPGHQLVNLGEFRELPRNSPVFGFVGDTFYFESTSDGEGPELWSSDGTVAGTGLYEDLFPGPVGSYPTRFSYLHDRAYFVANDYENGRELRVLEESASESRLVFDASSGNASSAPRDFSLVDDELWFIAFDNANGNQLWKSDGTEPGTVITESIHGVDFFAHVNDALYVSDNTEILKWENGISSSLREQTRSITDIAAVPDGRLLYVEFFDQLFSLNESGEDELIHELEGGQRIEGLFACLDDFCFYVTESDGRSVWKTDGTIEGTTELVRFTTDASAPYKPPVTADGYFSFVREEGLWISDGTPVNTRMAAHFEASTSVTSLGRETYFTSRFRSNRKLWKTNDQGGMGLVVDATGQDIFDPHDLIVTGDSLYFAAGECGAESTCQVWRVSESENAELLFETPVGSDPKQFQEFNGELYFSASTSETGRELWAYSFVDSTTRLVADINEGEEDGATGRVMATGAGLFIGATLQDAGNELAYYSQDREWYNAALPANVDWESGITPLDALLVINELSHRDYTDSVTGELGAELSPHALDVDNDGYVTPVDALLVINALDSNRSTARFNSIQPIEQRANLIDRVVIDDDWLLPDVEDEPNDTILADFYRVFRQQ